MCHFKGVVDRFNYSGDPGRFGMGFQNNKFFTDRAKGLRNAR